MPIRQVMFLTKVNNRLEEIEQLRDIQTLIAGAGRHLEEINFNSLMNQLRYGKG